MSLADSPLWLEATVPAPPPTTWADTVDAVWQRPDGRSAVVPAFWDGRVWQVRLEATPGRHRLSWNGSAVGEWSLALPSEVWPGALRHGPVQACSGDRVLHHRDGTPFLWLGDTWWHGLGSRLTDAEFEALARRRAEQGFSVVLIVAGLPVDVAFGDEGGASAAGWPWRTDPWEANQEWWKAAEGRILALLRAGLVPCIFGSWGYYLTWFDDERMLAHWRQMIARWSCLPVVWCLAGEATLPFYRPPRLPHASELAGRWAGLARKIRELDPHHRPLTAHPAPGSEHFTTSDMFPDDTGLFDIEFIQTFHSDQNTLAFNRDTVERALSRGGKPVVMAEVNYEGIASGSFHPMQRFLWWYHILTGLAGHTYGAQGLWGMDDGRHRGISGSWGDTTWREAAQLPGAGHVGLGRRLVEQWPWWGWATKTDSIEAPALGDGPVRPFAAGTGDQLIVYFPPGAMLPTLLDLAEVTIYDLTANATYDLQFVNPRTGAPEPARRLAADDQGALALPGQGLSVAPSLDDWLLVVTRA